MTWEGSNITGRLGPWPWGGGGALLLDTGQWALPIYFVSPVHDSLGCISYPGPLCSTAIAEEHVQARIGVIDVLYKLVIHYIFWS